MVIVIVIVIVVAARRTGVVLFRTGVVALVLLVTSIFSALLVVAVVIHRAVVVAVAVHNRTTLSLVRGLPGVLVRLHAQKLACNRRCQHGGGGREQKGSSEIGHVEKSSRVRRGSPVVWEFVLVGV